MFWKKAKFTLEYKTQQRIFEAAFSNDRYKSPIIQGDQHYQTRQPIMRGRLGGGGREASNHGNYLYASNKQAKDLAFCLN